MKKAIVGFAAAGTVVGFLFAVRRMGHEMREHCKQMASHCEEMASCCAQMAEQSKDRDEAIVSV